MNMNVSTDLGKKAIAQDAQNEKLKKTCAEFESLFIHQLLKSMRSSVTETGFLGNSEESKIIRSIFDQKLAEKISEKRGIGLARILFENFNNRKI